MLSLSLPRTPQRPPCAALSRRLQVCKGYPSAKEGLLVNARFLLSQFGKLDAASGHKALKFLDTDFGKSLAKEVRGSGRQLAGRALAPRQHSGPAVVERLAPACSHGLANLHGRLRRVRCAILPAPPSCADAMR